MKAKIAINGFGRIGRNSFRVAFDRSDIDIIAINDLTDTKTLAYLLKYDTVYGIYGHEVTYDENNLIVNGRPIRVLRQADPSLLPWNDLGVDIVIEATGKFDDPAKAKAHIDPSGAKRVVISAPTLSDDAQIVVIGANEDTLKQAGEIISGASCTTNCITPVIDILMQNFGIDKAMMTTVHSYTSSQRLLDGPARQLRECRSAASNIVPTSTGASIAAIKVIPDLAEKFEGLSVRVPTPVVSLADIIVITKKPTTIEEVNETFKKAAKEPYYQGIVTYSDEELVSSDYIGNSHSAIVDTKLTKVVGGNMVKVVAWYDNEWSYCNRLVELVADSGKLLAQTNPQQSYNVEETHIQVN